MALTFDDGPSAETTPQVLEALRERDVKATFFVLGRHADEYPALVAEIEAEGHQVASHGFDHALLTFATRDQVSTQLHRAASSIEQASGKEPTPYFRAPHGFRNPLVHRAAEGAGYRIVGWTKGVWYMAKPGVDAIVRRSVSGFRPGPDPAAARRRRLGARRRPDADGRGRAADRRCRPRSGLRVRDGVPSSTRSPRRARCRAGASGSASWSSAP